MSSQAPCQSAKRRVWTFIDYFVPQEAIHHQMAAFILNKMQPFWSEGLIEEVKLVFWFNVSHKLWLDPCRL